MRSIANELFLLSTNLSQLKDLQLVVKLFIESINDLFPGCEFSWTNNIENTDINKLQVCTRKNTYGYILYKKFNLNNNESNALFQNAVQLFAVVLEKLEQDKLLLSQKNHLNILVEEKTRDLLKKQEKLELQNKQIEQQNERYKKVNLDLKQAIIEAKENEAKHMFLFNNSQQGIVYHNKSGEVIYANKSALRILDLTLEQLQGKTAADPRWRSIHEDGSDYPGHTHPSSISLKKGVMVQNAIMGIYNYTLNNYTWININSYPKFKKNEITPYEVVVTFEDITEIKNAKQQAEQSDKLKTAFLQNISHEVRTPMNGIIGFADLLKETKNDTEASNHYLDVIINSCNQLLNIVDDIITISSLETEQVIISEKKVYLNDILKNVYNICKEKARFKSLDIVYNCGLKSNSDLIYIDKGKLSQILTNLVSNAIKFTDEGFVQFGYTVSNDKLNFYVRDSGIGIPQDKHQVIFERFRQANDEISSLYGGNGLGLSISKGLLELMGGSIHVSSDLGKGATFHFTLPYKPIKEILKNTPAIEINIPKKSLTMLVAEDEEINYLLIKELLDKLNIKAIRAHDGCEAINLFKNNSDINMILMDIKMPNMDGITATKEIKAINPNIKIIAQTAYALENEINKYKKMFDDYLIKPIKKEQLNQILSKFSI